MTTFTVTTDNPTEIYLILEALNKGEQIYRPVAKHEPESESRAGWSADAVPPPPAPDDPWAEDAQEGHQEPRRQAQTSSASDDKPTATVPRTGTHKVTTPNGVRYWTFGLANAPECGCGLKAARQAPSEQPPFEWARWTCPLRFSKDTYKGACDFNEFVSTKRGK